MLGEHDGLPPLGSYSGSIDEDIQAITKAALPAMGRLKAGKDVPTRTKLLARSTAMLSPSDPYWIEAFASGLTGEGSLSAAEANAVAMAGAWAVAESQMAKMIRGVNAHGSDEYAGAVTRALISSAPKFGERLMKQDVDSDEVMIRVALAHLFRRDAEAPMQIFVVDAAAKLLPKAMKMPLGAFVKSCLERFDEEELPVDAWGFVVVLRNLIGRAGYFLHEPTDETRAMVADLKAMLRAQLGDIDDETVFGHLLAIAVAGHLAENRVGNFASIIAVLFEERGIRYGMIYSGTRDEGTHTQFREIKADSINQARKMAANLPEVQMHDQFRAFSEAMKRMEEDDEAL